MFACNTKTVTMKVQLNSDEKNSHSPHECLDFKQQLHESKNPTMFYGELNKKQLKKNELLQNHNEGMNLRSGNRTNVHDDQKRIQDKSEDQGQPQNKLNNIQTFPQGFQENELNIEQHLYSQSRDGEQCISFQQDEKQEDQNSQESCSNYIVSSIVTPQWSGEFPQVRNQVIKVDQKQEEGKISERNHFPIKQFGQSQRVEQAASQNQTQTLQFNIKLEEIKPQKQSLPRKKTQPKKKTQARNQAHSQKKRYPYKNLERSLFTYLQQFIKKKEKEMGQRDEFKYFWRLKPQQVGKVKLIKLIYKQQQVLDFSIEFLRQKLWEQQAKLPKKVDQLKTCNDYYLKMLTTYSSFEKAKAYLKKSKIQFTN